AGEAARDDSQGQGARGKQSVSRRAGNGVCLLVRSARLPDARRVLRGAAAVEGRRVSVDSAPRGRISRRATRAGAQGARAPREEGVEAGRYWRRGRRETEREGADESLF